MMEGWKEYKINDVCQIIGGYAFKSKDFKSEGDIPIVKIKSLKDKKIVISGGEYVDNKFLQLNEKYHINYNDYIIALTGSHITLPSSAVGRVSKSKNKRTLLLNQRVGKFKVNEKLCSHDFLYHFLTTDYFFQNIGLRAKGAANQANISASDVGSIKISLPPLPTQKKIAQILSAYDDLIENNLARIKVLEEIAQKTYEEWFVHFKFPGYENAVFDEETGLPEGWEKVKLGSMCKLIMGQSPKSEFYNTEKKGLPFHQGVKDYGNRFPTNTMWSTSGNRIAHKGTVLFSVRAPVGRLNIALEKIILGRGLASISYQNHWNGFLYYQLKQIFFEDNLMGGGAIFNSVTKNDMLRIELIEGDGHTMQKFNKIVELIDDNIQNLHNQNQHLKEARDILLPRLMTGMIDVEKLQNNK